ncbi:hypothetical protein Rt10032_c08g3438 [Rhodotorula toruloides]|uniref:Proteophosphoglycan ppg4 n=1 Tax=Rhodotorula toruloides TaxID=5286 RepID=A0A511KGB5_RHOTO|nr:hypothetical protein Rt10032_c08g3438 [Rhodotorula toruloides]
MRTSALLSSLAALAALASAQHQDKPSHYDHQRQRRWVWGPSIIQDPTSGQDTATLPPIGSNVNQFTTPAQTITTPNSTPTMPSFPPHASSSSTSASSQSFGGGKQGAAAADATTPHASRSTIHRLPFVERKSSSLAAASSQPSATTTPASSSPTTAPPISRIVGHRTTTPTPPPSPTTTPPSSSPTTTPAETHRILWRERKESWLFAHPSSSLGSMRDVPPATTPATTTPAGGFGRTTPDPGTALHPPTFSGPPGTMPPGGVPGSYAISHLPSTSSTSTPTTPAQAVATGGALAEVEGAVGEVAGVVGGAVQGVRGMAGLAKREASPRARFQVVVKRKMKHSTLHERRRRTVSVD